jgi:hypothetical protein
MPHVSLSLLILLAKLLLTHFGERLVKLFVDWLIRYLADKLGVES